MAQLTKNAIREAFIALLNERPLDKISVVDIAERCGINRNTFYYYYCDIYDLLSEVLQIEMEKLAARSAKATGWQDACVNSLSFVRENRRAIYHLYNSADRDLLERYIYDAAYPTMRAGISLTAEGLNVPEHDIDLLAKFYTAALQGLVAHWLRCGMKTDVMEEIRELDRFISGNLRATLERNCGRK